VENTNNSLTAVAPHGGYSLSVVGYTYRIIIGSEQTNGAYALIDMLIPPKGGPGPHSHATFQEAFYVLDGEIRVITKEKTYTVTKGSYVNIPFNGPVHKFTNRTDKTAHFLCLTTPCRYGENVRRNRKAGGCLYLLTTFTNDTRRPETTSKHCRKVWAKVVPARLFRLISVSL
jgi:quercetin dioxygenase-like cupin family protein